MQFKRCSCLALVSMSLLAFAANAQDASSSETSRQQSIDARASATLKTLLDESTAARELFDRAAGYAVFTATKAGFLLTGGGGTGVAVDMAGGQRTYMRMGTGGLGLGIGAQRYELIILFEDTAHLARFTEGGWDASASAAAAAGSEGVLVNSSFIDGVAVFQQTKRGLMAQADVSGTRFWPIDDLNQPDEPDQRADAQR